MITQLACLPEFIGEGITFGKSLVAATVESCFSNVSHTITILEPYVYFEIPLFLIVMSTFLHISFRVNIV